MISCDGCGASTADAGAAGRQSPQPWAIILTPPDGVAIRAIHLCWTCAAELLRDGIDYLVAKRKASAKKPKGV